MKNKPKIGDSVQIEWYDARFFPNTYTKEECLEHHMCLFTSLGYLLSQDDITTRIAAEKNNEDEYRDILKKHSTKARALTILNAAKEKGLLS